MADRIDIYIKVTLGSILEDNNINGVVAKKIIAELMSGISEKYGCDRHYIPAPSKSERNAEIIRLGKQSSPRLTVEQIANQLGISVATVKRVIAAKAKPKANRGFGSPEWNL